MKRYGFIHDKFEIKFLILYAMCQVDMSVSFDDISEMTLCDDAIDYFEYAESVAELVKTGHLEKDSQERYSITQLGTETAKLFEKNIAYSVRQKALTNAKTVRSRNKRKTMVRAGIKERPGGSFAVHLSLDDNIENIMELELMCPTESQAREIKDLYLKNAEKIYGAVLNAILSSGTDK